MALCNLPKVEIRVRFPHLACMYFSLAVSYSVFYADLAQWQSSCFVNSRSSVQSRQSALYSIKKLFFRERIKLRAFRILNFNLILTSIDSK